MGFLGVGWLSGRRWLVGIPLLLVWYPFLIGYVLFLISARRWAPDQPVALIGALLLLPIYVGVPLVSAFAVRRRLQRDREPRVAPGNDSAPTDRSEQI